MYRLAPGQKVMLCLAQVFANVSNCTWQFGWSDPATPNQPGVDFTLHTSYAFHLRLRRVIDNDGDSSPLEDREIFKFGTTKSENLPQCIPRKKLWCPEKGNL